MTLSDLASIGSFISALAVLVSLVYLGLQVRQTEKNQKALIQQGRAARIADSVLQISEALRTVAFVKGQNGDETMSVVELTQFRLIFRSMMISAEDSHFQYGENLLSEKAYESLVASMKFMLVAPGLRAMWAETRDMYEPSFKAFVDQVMRETQSAPPVDELARWKANLAAVKSLATR